MEAKPTDNLASLLACFEGRRIDFKEEVSDTFYKLLSAFANTSGGTAVIGVRDSDHAVTGIDLRNNAQKKLADSISSRLGIHPVIETHEVEGKNILAVTVEQSRTPVACDGRYYTRVGDTTREMLPDELRVFFQESIEWDSVTGTFDPDEIDRESVRRFLTLARTTGRITVIDPDESVDAVLSRLGLIRDGRITNGAIILFGKDPQTYFPNTIIRIGRFRQADIIIGDHEIRGNLFVQFEEAERIIKNYIGVRYDISGEAMQESFQRKEVWEYPLPAIREALLNALIHRDYFNNTIQTQVRIFDDHIRFHNAGRLPEGVTIEMILREHYSYLRNPKIADVFYRSGLVERYGSGIERIIRALEEEKLPAPEIVSTPLGFTLTLRMNQFTDEFLQALDLNDRQIAAISFLKEHGTITNTQYQNLNAVAARTALRDLNDMVTKHILERRGISRRDTHYVLFREKKGSPG
ncbi:ATP-binding protein [uncultured Methanofollis sp.]|uniref:ATP-binding protein n=1 Tax=uncultured Methanofollis sp. TaxID=262500 RepID=UPI002624CAF2|nr:ATP-binding protein [uncultured Methanofollis sp.]